MLSLTAQLSGVISVIKNALALFQRSRIVLLTDFLFVKNADRRLNLLPHEIGENEMVSRCFGVPGTPCGRKIPEEDVMAVDVPGLGIIGDCCIGKLTSGRSWGSQLETISSEVKARGPRSRMRKVDKMKSGPQFRNYRVKI
jgi:hypothetical protein